MTINVIITICVALAAMALAIWAIVRAFMRVNRINKKLEEYNKELSKAHLALEEANNRVEMYKQESITLRRQLVLDTDIIKGLEDTVEKFHAASKKKEEPKAIYYIQLKYNTADAKPWENLTKDLFYDRRNFRSLREAVKELKRRMNDPYVLSARIVTANERILKKGEWYV